MFNYTITHEELFPDRIANTCQTYIQREAVRAVIEDTNNKIALVEGSKSGFYFLPGGGVEPGETLEEALRRECMEETGCEIGSIEKLGVITAHGEEDCKIRIAYCYTARAVSQNSRPEENIQVIFVPKESALEMLKKQFDSITPETPNFYSRKFNTRRDILILESLC